MDVESEPRKGNHLEFYHKNAKYLYANVTDVLKSAYLSVRKNYKMSARNVFFSKVELCVAPQNISRLPKFSVRKSRNSEFRNVVSAVFSQNYIIKKWVQKPASDGGFCGSNNIRISNSNVILGGVGSGYSAVFNDVRVKCPRCRYWVYIPPIADSADKPPKIIPEKFTIGWDTEFVKKNDLENEVISTQLWIAELNFGFIFYHLPGKRTEISTMLEFILNYLNITSLKEVRLLAHFNIAEFSTLSQKGRDEVLDILNATILRKSAITMRKINPLKLKLAGVSHWNKTEVRVSLHDSILLLNDKLEKIGKALNFEKLDVGENISKMDELVKVNSQLFRDYAIRDAEICAKFHAYFADLCQKIGISKMPVTSSGLGILLLRKHLTKQQFKIAIGGDDYMLLSSGKRARLTKKVKRAPKCEIFRETYHGGRNECYIRGNFNGTSMDYDLKNAYPSAMLMIRNYDFTQPTKRYSENWRQEIKHTDFGKVDITFKVKETVKYPPFAYEDPQGKGLIFASSGRVCVTSIELWTALQNGWIEEVVIHDSEFWEPVNDEPGYLGQTVAYLVKKRQEYPKNSIFNTLYKLAVNSLYGKYAQGLKRTDMPESAITNPAIASHITAIVRMAVCEHLNYIDTIGQDKFMNGPCPLIISCTTDGYLLGGRGLSEQENTLIHQLPLSAIISKHRGLYLGDKELLELKHENHAKFFSYKTRCYGQYDGNDSISLFAKGGRKILGDFTNTEKKAIIDDTASKGWYTETRLTEKDEIYNRKKYRDLVNYIIERKAINFDLDFKRRFHYAQNLQTREIEIYTTPYETIEEFETAKKLWANFYEFISDDTRFSIRNVFFSQKRFKQFLIYAEMRKISLEKERIIDFETFVNMRLAAKLKTSVRAGAEIIGQGKTFVDKWKNTDFLEIPIPLWDLLVEFDPTFRAKRAIYYGV